MPARSDFCKRTSSLLVLLLLLCMLILTTGCNSNTESKAHEQALITHQDTQQATPTATGTTTSTTPATVTLHHVPTGTLKLAYVASAKTLAVAGSINGLAPNSQHDIQIQEGSCSSTQPGTVKYTLPAVQANAHGHVTVKETINDVPDNIPATGLSLHILSANTNSQTSQKLSLACTDISNPGNSSNVSLTLGAAAPMNNATGSAQISSNNGTNSTITIKINASGLAPDSTYQAEMHSRTCRAPGQTLYTLDSLQSDSSGNLNQSVTVNSNGVLSPGTYSVVLLANTKTMTITVTPEASATSTSTATPEAYATPTATPEAYATPTATPEAYATATGTSTSATPTSTGTPGATVSEYEPVLCGNAHLK